MSPLYPLLIAALPVLVSAPAAGQGHPASHQPPATAAKASCSPEHAAMGHCTLPAPKPALERQPAAPVAPACSPEHAAMGHCTLPAAPPVKEAVCLPEHAAMGHCAPAAPAAGEGTDLPAGSSAPPPVPTDHAADAVYGQSAMAMGRHHLVAHHGGQAFYLALLDIAEARMRNGRDGYAWEGEVWYGGDLNRFVLKSEGEGDFGGSLESAEVQALLSRAIGPYFDVQAGIRYDFEPGPSRAYATIGFEGLAPGFLDVEGALFLSDRGELMGRLEASYDQRITQELILQPRAELDLAAQGSRDIGVGRGLVAAEIGMRLRYDIAREFAPYVGIHYEHALGETRRFRRDEGARAAGWNILAGIRAWF